MIVTLFFNTIDHCFQCFFIFTLQFLTQTLTTTSMIIFGDISTIRVPIDDTFNLFSCVQPCSSDRLIITESSYLSVLYNLNNLLPIKSWKFTQLDHLTAPVVFDQTNQRFVALKNKKISFLFEDEQLVQFKLKNNPICVISPSFGESLVLFQNGFLRKISSVILEKNELYSNSFIQPNESILKIKVKELNDCVSMIALLCQSADNKKKIYFIKYGNQKEEIIQDGFFDVAQECTSFILMSNGDILSIINKSAVSLLTQNNVEKLLLTFDYNEQIIAAVGLNHDDFALILKRVNENTHFLCNFNINYEFKLSEVALDLMPLEECLIDYQNCLYIACTKGLMIIPFQLKFLSLADVLGKGSLKEKANQHVISHVETQMLDLLSQKKDFTSLNKILSKPKHQISERCLFEIFNSLINLDNISIDNKTFRSVLDNLFCLSFNHDLMIEVMKEKNLSTETLNKMLDLLIQILEVDNDIVFDWIVAIIDSFFTSIILTKSETVKKLFKQLMEKIENIAKILSHCEDLKLTIQSIINNQLLNPNLHSSLYSKEEFMIGTIHL